jgi:hypothetical protein
VEENGPPADYRRWRMVLALLPPPAKEGPLTLFETNLVSIIGMKGEEAKAEARRALDV